MKLKKLLKLVDAIDYSFELRDRNDEKLFEGYKYDIPKEYRKWYIDDGGYPSIYAETSINSYGVTIVTMIIYIRPTKEEVE